MSQALRAKNIVLGTGITEDRHHVALHPEEPGTGAGTRAKDAYGEEWGAPADYTKDCGALGAGEHLSQPVGAGGGQRAGGLR